MARRSADADPRTTTSPVRCRAVCLDDEIHSGGLACCGHAVGDCRDDGRQVDAILQGTVRRHRRRRQQIFDHLAERAGVATQRVDLLLGLLGVAVIEPAASS